MDRVIKIIGAIAVVGLVLSAAYAVSDIIGKSSPSPALPAGGTPVYFFYGEECPHCHDVMPFITNLSKKYPEADIRMLEVWHNQTNQKTYQSVLKSLNRTASGVPVVVIGETVLVGSRNIPQNLEALVRQRLRK